MDIYNEDYYSDSKMQDKSYLSAKIIIDILSHYFTPKSVIDVGAGLGAWLKAWQEIGVDRIKGLDSNSVDEKLLFIPRTLLKTVNLTEYKNTTKERFELCMSLEVAEHLENEYSRSFIQLLTSFSDNILFSAALPLQDGRGHVNCQYHNYWVSLFKDEGYVCFDFIRPKLFNSHSKVQSWYIQNILYFVKKSVEDYYIKLGLMPIDQPFCFYHKERVEKIVTDLKSNYEMIGK